MKQLTLIALLPLLHFGPTITGSATPLLNEPFAYPDGPLITVSQSAWFTHGGDPAQIQVISGRVELLQSNTEDVSTQIPGGPFRGPTLYAALTVNLQSLPTGSGAYFAHFKDASSTGFRARIFASTNSAVAGKWRVGIANGAGTPVFVPRDLEPGTDYLVALRFDTGNALASLWINPVAESSTLDRADAADATTLLSITTFSLRQAVASGSGMGHLLLDNLRVGTNFVDVLDSIDPRREPPTLSALPEQFIPANTSTPAVPFVIGDGQTAAGNLLLRAASADAGLVAVSGVVFGGGGSNRTVTVTPVPGRQGATRVTVTVTDADGNTANGTFQVTVGVPHLSPLPDQITAINTSTPAIPLKLGDAEADVLTVWGTSTNTDLLPVSALEFKGTGYDRTLTLHPTSGLVGLSQITLFVSDGFNTISNQFLLTVHPIRGLLLSEPFSYPDGSLTTNSQFAWKTHSAGADQTGQTQVIHGRLLLSASQGEDLHADLAQSPYPAAESWVLYARFELNCQSRPTAAGGFFAHFRGANSGTSARVFVTSSDAAPGMFRVGLANNSTTLDAVVPVDLATNTGHIVVIRLNVATGQSTLWVNPERENDPHVDASDDPAPFSVVSYAFRQASGIGTLLLDDLRIGTEFKDVVTPAFRLSIRAINGEIELRWPTAAAAAGLHLESTSWRSEATWLPLAPDGQLQGEDWVVRLPADENHFFRLAH